MIIWLVINNPLTMLILYQMTNSVKDSWFIHSQMFGLNFGMKFCKQPSPVCFIKSDHFFK